jgi:L-ascorbate metabolism protein UlaG (beta-lactamase superfamily)
MPKMNELNKRIRSNPFVRNFSNVEIPQSKREVKPSVPIKPVDQRLPPKVLESVMSILVSVQWDRWRFMLPAKPLLKLDVAVVSHGHADHWHPNFWQKDLVLLPRGIKVPEGFSSLRNAVQVDRYISLKGLQLLKLDGRALRQLLGPNTPNPHASWWIATSSGARVLFIGDMNIVDAETALHFIRESYMSNAQVHGVVLPSFGGVMTHGARDAREVAREAADVAFSLAEKFNVAVGAVPHPVPGCWADFNAVAI